MKFKIFLLFIIPLLSACSYLPEEDKAELNLIDNNTVRVEEDTEFIYLTSNSNVARPNYFIFYPGGLVDPHAYIGLLQNLTSLNTNVIIVKSNSNLAITDISAAKPLIESIRKSYEEYAPSINEKIIVAGHSLGGSVACFLTDDLIDSIDGLILFASYPANSTDLSSFSGRVLSLTGSNDEVLDLDTYESSKSLLPTGQLINNISEMPLNIEEKSTIYYEIEGGNHSGFGNYGAQNGDGERDIQLVQQYQEIISTITSFYIASGW